MSKAKREIRRGVCMTLELKNIGMIKEANVKIDGLTVIAGENDTGKSTAGKALYLLLQSIEEILSGVDIGYSFMDIFKQSDILPKDGYLSLETEKNHYKIFSQYSDISNPYIIDSNDTLLSCIFIETPLVWNFTDFFRDIAQVESRMRIELD